jgi:hypothetical protein
MTKSREIAIWLRWAFRRGDWYWVGVFSAKRMSLRWAGEFSLAEYMAGWRAA